MRRFLAVVVVLACAWGCTPQAAYIEADRATFDVIAPAYLGYVQADPALDQDQIDRRQRFVDTWRIRIEKAEGGGT